MDRITNMFLCCIKNFEDIVVLDKTFKDFSGVFYHKGALFLNILGLFQKFSGEIEYFGRISEPPRNCLVRTVSDILGRSETVWDVPWDVLRRYGTSQDVLACPRISLDVLQERTCRKFFTRFKLGLIYVSLV